MKLSFAAQLPLIVVLLLAAILRFYHLGSNPPSLDWDEASLGYNAYSLLKTARDEYGNFLPLSIRSFNDFKPPVYAYLTIPSVALFGLNEFAVRFPSALLGILAVAAIYALTLQVFFAGSYRHCLALIAAGLLAVSPWHLQFSRVAFEANAALSFYIFSIYFFLSHVNRDYSLVKGRRLLLVLSALAAAASMYSYHSARLVVPLTFLLLSFVYRSKLLSQPRVLILPVFSLVLLLMPLVLNFQKNGAASRFQSTSIFTNPGEFSRERERIDRIRNFKANSLPVERFFYTNKAALATLITRNYFEHFNLDFLFLHADQNPRHHAQGVGLLYLIELPFLLYGGYKLIGSKTAHKWVVFAILLAAPTASAVTVATPHAVRSILLIPAMIILVAYGVFDFLDRVDRLMSKPFYKGAVVSIFMLFLGLNFFYYLNLYYVVTPSQVAKDWQYGHRQLVEKIFVAANQNYEQVLVTNHYDQPHIFFAFFGKIDPGYYQSFAETANQNIDNIIFKPINSQDFQQPHTLIAVEPERSPGDIVPIDQIFFPNGQIAFNIYQTK